jgi:hypothetical protein
MALGLPREGCFVLEEAAPAADCTFYFIPSAAGTASCQKDCLLERPVIRKIDDGEDELVPWIIPLNLPAGAVFCDNNGRERFPPGPRTARLTVGRQENFCMSDPSSEKSEDFEDLPVLEPVLPDEYPLASPAEKVGPPPLPAWYEKTLSSIEEKERAKQRAEPSFLYPFRELILLATGLTGFLALVCIRLDLRGMALGIIVLGILLLGWLIILAVLQRRREAANGSPVDLAAWKAADRTPAPPPVPAAPPFQFTLADLMLTVTAMACLMSLTTLLPGGSKLSYIAGISGACVFLGLIVFSLSESVHRVVRLMWIMLFIIYIFSSLAAIFWEVK